MKGLKKVTSYILITFVLLITIVSLLGIWDVISLEDVMRKIFTSLFVVFVASVIVLFIFSVIIRDSDSTISKIISYFNIDYPAKLLRKAMPENQPLDF